MWSAITLRSSACLFCFPSFFAAAAARLQQLRNCCNKCCNCNCNNCCNWLDNHSNLQENNQKQIPRTQIDETHFISIKVARRAPQNPVEVATERGECEGGAATAWEKSIKETRNETGSSVKKPSSKWPVNRSKQMPKLAKSMPFKKSLKHTKHLQYNPNRLEKIEDSKLFYNHSYLKYLKC